MMRRISSVGGMNKTHRLSQGAKRVTPPSIPTFNPRGSGSSFGSDYSYERDDSAFSRDPSGTGCSATDQRNGVSGFAKSPGRDSPGDDSSASFGTVESSSVSSGYRNSTTSLDSGRASNSNSAAAATTDLSSFHTIQPILEHRAMVSVHPQPGNRFHHHQHSNGGGFHPSSTSSFRQSCHSSTSSLGAAAEDSICALDIPEMVANGVQDREILLAWLTDLHHEEYYDLFVSAGYDMPTISRMTPEDLTAIGIKKPNHRKRLKAEITRLNIPDGLPDFIPDTLDEWLFHLRLDGYGEELRSQRYSTIDDVAQISIEDLEDVGLLKLGHQKRFLLAIKRIKDLKSGRRVGAKMSTFRQQQPKKQQPEYASFRTNHPLVPNVVHRTAQAPPKPVYQPEVIRIDRWRTNPHPPPASPPEMPRPMQPLSSAYAVLQQPASIRSDGRQWGASRSYDDGDISLVRPSNGAGGGGGTLPRPKGLVKPRPVAKIPASPHRHQPVSEEAQEDLKKPFLPSQRSAPDLDVPRHLRRGEASFPFANENAGTIRIRSNSQTSQLSPQSQDDDAWNGRLDATVVGASHAPPPKRTGAGAAAAPGQQRSAGDVLNDIGSMLADLTDELDAMLHMERDSNKL